MVDNIKIPFERLANIRVAVSVSNGAVSGVARHTLSADILLDGEEFSAGAECVLQDSENKFSFPKFYIYQRKKCGNVLTISAIDRLVMTGQPFDYSGLTVTNEKVLVSSVMAQIYTQCGFDGASYDKGAIADMPLAYVKGKSCEEILNGFSALFCGVWCSDNQNRLVLKRWGVPDGVAGVSAASEAETTSEKGEIARVIATDGITGAVFDTLGSADFLKTLRISADYMTEAQANSILAAYTGKKYFGWKCKAELSSMAEIGFSFDGRFVGNITFYPHLGGLGAELGAPDISETEWDYYGEVTKALNKKLGIGVQYGTVSIEADL